MTKIPSRTPAALLVAALALAAAGCGSSSANNSTRSSTSAASTSPTATSTSAGGYRGYGGTSSGASGTASTTPAAASGSAVVVTVSAKSSKLGTILAAGPKQKTVYLFESDTASGSACSAACAAVWPPVTGSAAAGAGASSADLGTITRSDGTKQVTYKGHPLYFYARDGDKGDAYGQGIKSFGAAWYVLAPSGKKIDNS